MSIESRLYARGRGSVSASFADACQASQEPGNLAWISLVEPSEEDFGAIADNFGTDPRLLEDAARFPHRSNIEMHEDLLVAVLPVMRASDGEENTNSRPESRSVVSDWVLALAAGDPNMVVAFTDGDPSVLDGLRRRLEQEPHRLAEDSRAVLLQIVDEVIGDYESAVEALDGGIRDVEVAVLEGRAGNVLPQIHELTSQAVGLQQAVKPLASALERLTERGAPVAHTHLSRIRRRTLCVTEGLDSSRALLSNLLAVNLTAVGQKISAWGAILIVPTLIAGVFGMNVTQPWWTRADHGFEVMIAVMLLVSGALYLWFKRSGWL